VGSLHGREVDLIDLAQADTRVGKKRSRPARLRHRDGAPFEGDVCGKGLASEMPDW
jgi:multiple sugar transport system substrate-binding protein